MEGRCAGMSGRNRIAFALLLGLPWHSSSLAEMIRKGRGTDEGPSVLRAGVLSEEREDHGSMTSSERRRAVRLEAEEGVSVLRADGLRSRLKRYQTAISANTQTD